MSDIVIVNGQPAEQLSVYDRGLAYGDGLFETVLCRNGKLLLWGRHLQRLASSLAKLQIQPYDTAQLLPTIEPYLDKAAEKVIKIIVTRGEGQRGYACPEPMHANTLIFISDLQQTNPGFNERGVKACICETRLGYQPKLAGLKHLNRLEQILAQMELANTEFQEGLMLGQQGEVVEAIRHNLFLVKNGELFTPELSNCGVAGIMRTFIIEIARKLGLSVQIGIISVKQLMQANEIFLSNSINGIWPICELNGTRFATGKVTCLLRDKAVELIQHHD